MTNPPDAVFAGNPTTLTCVSSASKPQACIRAYIRTSANIRELDPGYCNQESSSVQTTTRTFTFTASAEENGAKLYCNASNSVTDHPVRSQVYTLNVQSRPQFPRQSNQQAAALGENIRLMFKFVSNPAYVNLTWYKLINGTAEKLTVSNSSGSKYRSRVTDAIHKFLFNKAEVQLSGHLAELEISDVKRDDFGQYKFVAENDVGSSETIISFNLIDRPCPPILTTTFCENRMANVTWISCFNGGSTQTFKLLYKKKAGHWVELPDNITDPGEDMAVSEVVKGLEERGEYSFRVYGFNRWNKSDTVETSCTVTAPGSPGAPGALTGPLAGGISGAIVLMGVVLLVVVILRRRKQGSRSSGETK
ncbi:twitchin-like [Liolophura sinensis]|uniref:twitchin-like n=1 Tax=Liolophura sinensis TaxID=3198878 RepID=UPI0031599255